MMLGQADLQLREPQPALAAFDKAVESSPFAGEGNRSAQLQLTDRDGTRQGMVSTGRCAAAVISGRGGEVGAGRRKALAGLADLYEAQGRTTLAGQARGARRPGTH